MGNSKSSDKGMKMDEKDDSSEESSAKTAVRAAAVVAVTALLALKAGPVVAVTAFLALKAGPAVAVKAIVVLKVVAVVALIALLALIAGPAVAVTALLLLGAWKLALKYSLMEDHAEGTVRGPHEGFCGSRTPTAGADKSILSSSSLMEGHAEETARGPQEGFRGSRTPTAGTGKSILSSSSLMEGRAEETTRGPHEGFRGSRTGTATADKNVLASSSLMEGRAEATACGTNEGFRGSRTTTTNNTSVSRFGSSSKNASKRMIKIMTYNVWFREDVEIYARMGAIRDLIAQHAPDVIFFQEVTPNIYKIFQGSKFWGDYRCSLSHQDATERSNSTMLLSKLPMKSFYSVQLNGRDFPIAVISISNPPKTLIVATAHLPRQTSSPDINRTERMSGAKSAINIINCGENVVFGGDMNWVDASDGQFPLLHKWVDAWEKMHPKKDGWTYDTKTNAMLKGRRTVQERLDRFLCKLKDFRLVDLVLIGSDPIPGASHRNQNGKLVPVYPSDHYGLLLTIELK